MYRRHTNFAIESIEQTFNGSVAWNKKVSATISRNGDLITNMFLEITMKKGASGSTYYPAEAFVKDVELEIGGQKIDKHYSDWFRVYDELFRQGPEKDAYRGLTDFVDGEAAGTEKRFYLPLIFFFNRNPGLALPLIALQYHEVKIHLTIANHTEIAGIASDTPTASLYVDYIYLDTDERRRFAQVSHEYLIEQLQFTGDETVKVENNQRRPVNVRLNFNHPVKYLAWAVKGDTHGKFTATSNAIPVGTAIEACAPLYSAKLQLNGHDRFSERKGSYFNRVQPFQHLQCKPAAGVYMYSFALKPQEHQPSGTCNFSRIDNATLQLTMKQADSTATTVADISDAYETQTLNDATNLTTLKVFATSYNVLRIMSGINHHLCPTVDCHTGSEQPPVWANSVSARGVVAAY